ncbi:MAG: DUF2851 family protein, partial [Chloroflexi bacterium]|nr:DUF2851 family protein [Chloroflexota bacterium]
SVDGSDVWAEALLLGIEKLLPSQQGATAADPYESALERCSSGLASGGRAPPAPAISPRRPANHPARRLAGVARLLVRHRALLDGGAMPERHLALSTPELIAAWTVAASGYWRCHMAPGAAAKRSPGALIGRSRAIELLTNAVLPWAAAVAEARGESPSAATRSFHTLPRPGRYGALAFLEANLKQSGVSLPLNARRQQGLLALYKTECTQGGCGRCPLS